MNASPEVLCVIGGQYGSEGKGVIVNHLANRYDVHIRSGGPNAGHSFSRRGKVWKMQMVPCGWTNPFADLIISRGAILDIERLIFELDEIADWADENIWSRVFVDSRAAVLEDRHRHRSKIDNRTASIGSTGEGVGSARLARVARNPEELRFFEEVVWEHPRRDELQKLVVSNTPNLISQMYSTGSRILLEGTQGVGLSLIHGHWPYTTSHDVGAATLAADAGIPPTRISRVLCVIRTYPIRVAGNSGPLTEELSWKELSDRLGREVVERTTVTKKIRRIGEWDEELVENAVTLNRPDAFALMFADYLNPADEGVTKFDELSSQTRLFVQYLESFYQIPVDFVGTGGDGWMVVDRGRF